MAGAKSRRQFNPISLAFLDVMSCGFGAVVLIFLIIDHNLDRQTGISDPNLAAEISLLEEEILEGRENLARIRNTLSDVDFQMVQAQGLARSIEDEINTIMEEIARMENEAASSEDVLERLRSEIAQLEQELQRMREAEEQMAGNNIRQFVGDGNRQYLTGMYLGGNRILVLLDISTSMLDDTIVNIIRRRNMAKDAQLNSPKWVRTRNIMEWLTAQLPIPSQYQIYLFNTEVKSAVPGTEGRWLEVADADQLNRAVDVINSTVPNQGNNLEAAFRAVSGLNPLPDNIFLITDSLPTQGSQPPRGTTISGREREQLFERALRELPNGIPVNIIMLPLEGDPMAAPYFWQLAYVTKGSYLSPAEDWP